MSIYIIYYHKSVDLDVVVFYMYAQFQMDMRNKYNINTKYIFQANMFQMEMRKKYKFRRAAGPKACEGINTK